MQVHEDKGSRQGQQGSWELFVFQGSQSGGKVWDGSAGHSGMEPIRVAQTAWNRVWEGSDASSGR